MTKRKMAQRIVELEEWLQASELKAVVLGLTAQSLRDMLEQDRRSFVSMAADLARGERRNAEALGERRPVILTSWMDYPETS